MIEDCKFIAFPQKGDERGHLVIIEGNQDIPFDIKRVFYIYGSDRDVIRGRHANYNSEFVLINVSGRLMTGQIKKYLILTDRMSAFTCPSLSGRTCMIFRRIRCFYACQANIMTQTSISGTMINI